ncbi:MAG: hypothetical protein HOH58_14070 [Opitutaceae bacterium]|jgi:hypothetical protein|nr:hypothetical protein [Opitutaceae bacterium]
MIILKKYLQIILIVLFANVTASGQEPAAAPQESKSPISEGLGYRFFSPSARVYFDTGTDDPGEIDIFNDGAASVNISLLELVYRVETHGRLQFQNGENKLYFGPAIGVGLTSPASDSQNGATDAGSSPVVMVSAGVFAEIQVNQSSDSVIILETGYAIGYSASETATDNNDGALYVGLGFDF